MVMAVGLAGACQVQPHDDITPDGDIARDGTLPLSSIPRTTKVPAPLPGAHCSISVEGQGVLDMEEDYLPHVIQCENGGANLEALKAQAIAARSVAYYAIETSGSICDSQGCQVYSCGNTPSALQHQAVEETSGQYLMFNSTLTYGFYVAGDNNTAPPACVGDVNGGATEHWVTYNEGQSGFDVEQTELGFVHQPGDFGYGQNRGCMSQWGARCLENDNGYDYLDILRFYYGDDIELVQAEGACVIPGEGDSSSGDAPGDSTAGDETTSGPDEPLTTGAAGTSDSGADPDTGVGDGTLPPGGTAADTGPFDSAGDGSDGVNPALPTTFGENDEGGGCACRSEATPRGGAGGWLMVLGLLAWRRRRP